MTLTQTTEVPTEMVSLLPALAAKTPRNPAGCRGKPAAAVAAIAAGAAVAAVAQCVDGAGRRSVQAAERAAERAAEGAAEGAAERAAERAAVKTAVRKLVRTAAARKLDASPSFPHPMALLKNENELAPNSPKNEAAWNRRYNLRKRRHSVRVLAGFHEYTHVWNLAQARGTVLQKDICDKNVTSICMAMS